MGNFNVSMKNEMNLLVQVLPGGATLPLTVASSITVRQLKVQLARELPELPASRMFIVHEYQVLQDHQVLGAVLRTGSIIVLAFADNSR